MSLVKTLNIIEHSWTYLLLWLDFCLMFLNNPPRFQSMLVVTWSRTNARSAPKILTWAKWHPVPSRCDAGLNDKSYTFYPLKHYVNPCLLTQSQLRAVGGRAPQDLMWVQLMSGWTAPGENKAVSEIWPDWPQSCLSTPYLPLQGHAHMTAAFSLWEGAAWSLIPVTRASFWILWSSTFIEMDQRIC